MFWKEQQAHSHRTARPHWPFAACWQTAQKPQRISTTIWSWVFFETTIKRKNHTLPKILFTSEHLWRFSSSPATSVLPIAARTSLQPPAGFCTRHPEHCSTPLLQGKALLVPHCSFSCLFFFFFFIKCWRAQILYYQTPATIMTQYLNSRYFLSLLFCCLFLLEVYGFLGQYTGIDFSNNNIKYKVPKAVQIILDITAL